MSRAGSMPPLVVKWSAGSVAVFDPVDRSTTSGSVLSDCLNGHTAGREAVVAVGQRSAFIRTLQVPALSNEETRQMLALKLAPLMPIDPGSYVFGYRLGPATDGQGRTAVVGAVKTATLRDIEQDCAQHGLQVRAVLPLAFGSWLAARERMVADGAVVETDRGSLNVDILSEGELKYSRSVPLPTSQAGVQDEISRSFEIAAVDPGPVLTIGDGSRSSLEHLADTRQVDRLLFTLELPERARSRRSKGAARAAQRAIVAAIIALALGGWAAQGQIASSRQAAKDRATVQLGLSAARAHQKDATDETMRAKDQRDLVQAAFRPAQSFSDVLSVATGLAPKEVWLTGVTLERGKPLILRGSATNGKSVAAYVKRLAKDSRFRHMKLIFATRTTIAKVPVVEFSISGHVLGNLPINQVPREAKS